MRVGKMRLGKMSLNYYVYVAVPCSHSVAYFDHITGFEGSYC